MLGSPNLRTLRVTESVLCIQCRSCGRRRDLTSRDFEGKPALHDMVPLHQIARDRLRCECGAKEPYYVMVRHEEAKELFGRPLPEGRRQDPTGPFYPGR